MFASDPPYEGGLFDFYKWWLENVIVFSSWFLVGITIALWITAIILEYNYEDANFLVVYPAITVLVYSLYSPLSFMLINSSWDKTVKYFEEEEIKKHKEE